MEEKEKRERDFAAFAKLWRCPRCNVRAKVFQFCDGCWPSIYGQFELDHRGRSLAQGEWA